MNEIINIEYQTQQYGIKNRFVSERSNYYLQFSCNIQPFLDQILQNENDIKKESLLEADMPEHLKGQHIAKSDDILMKKQSQIKKSFFAQFFTTISFVLSDLRKKKNSFQIGIITVFMVVSFTTFICAFVNSSPSLFIMVAQANGGDYDLVITSLPRSQYLTDGNKNFYMNQQEKYENFGNKNLKHTYNENRVSISPLILNQDTAPLINYTKVQNEIQNNPEVEGAYPRWLALAKISSNQKSQSQETASFVTYGDQKLERDLNVADGFPTTLLNQNETIAAKGLLQIFDLTKNDQIEVIYDFLQFLPPSFNPLQMIIFDYQPRRRQDPTKGEVFLMFFKINPFSTFGNIKQQMLFTNKPLEFIMLQTVGDLWGIKDYELISPKINKFLKTLIKDDFILTKNYLVKEEVTMLYGKWARAFGNAIFLDSNYLKDTLLSQIQNNAKEYIVRNKLSFDTYLQVNDLFANLKDQSKNISINDYSMSVNLHFKDRMKKYVTNNGQGIMQTANSIYKSQLLFETSKCSPIILMKAEKMDTIKIMLTNIFINLTLFIFFMSFILYYSLVKSDIQERTYDYAMLRIQGYESRGLISLLTLRTLLFSVPGFIVGFVVMMMLLLSMKLIIFAYIQFKLYIEISKIAIFTGIFMGIFVPLLANIVPIYEVIGYSLRDSLNLYRNKVGNLSIQLYKLENMGVSLSQFLIGICFSLFGFVTYYFVPLSFILQDLNLFFFLLLTILFLMILGMSFIALIFVPYIENIILKIIFLINYKDRKLKSIVQKYLRSHQAKNIKASMMFTVTITFLIYVGTSFAQVEYMMMSLTQSFIGTDIALFRGTDFGSEISLNEYQLRQFLEKNHIRNGGIVTQYGFLAQSLNDILREDNGKRIKVGFGIKNQEFYSVTLVGLEQNHLQVQSTEYFYPTEIWETPNSILRKTYQEDQVLDMLYDLAPLSYYQEQVDPIKISTNNIIQNYTLDSSIINVLIPEAFRGVFPIKAGDMATLCVGSYNRGIMWSESSCQLQYKARIVGTLQRMPGLLDVSAYKPAVYISPSVIISLDQMEYLISQYLDRFPKTKERYEKQIDMNQRRSTYQIPKKMLYVKVLPNTTDTDINKLSNLIVKEAGEQNTYSFNIRQFFMDLKNTLFIMYIASSLISIILFVLTFFQLIVTLSSNLRDNEQELGILRAIGIQKNELHKITLYEALANIASSGILGLLIGIIASISMTSLFFMIVELPFKLIISYPTILYMLIMTSIIIIFGTYIGTKSINEKQITKILKGQ